MIGLVTETSSLIILLFHFLFSQGVSRENLALVNIPVTLVTIIAPLIIRHTKRPLIWFARSYVFHLINAIPLAAYVYLTPRMISSGYYYPVLILLLALNAFIATLQSAAQVGFFASISDPRIGGTYMTFLVTLSNLGFALNSSAVLNAVDWLPKRYAYLIAVASCNLFGILWLGLSYRTLERLQELPTCRWYLMEELITDDTTTSKEQDQNDHQVSLIPGKESEQIASI
jgi:PAT family acetyl-CoA transporter-like MFS transporter 1